MVTQLGLAELADALPHGRLTRTTFEFSLTLAVGFLSDGATPIRESLLDF
jgi:hypothetical protein